jgi:hypothetical protein
MRQTLSSTASMGKSCCTSKSRLGRSRSTGLSPSSTVQRNYAAYPIALKELEYVLDLAPRYLWIVGPGSVDPPTHVFHVTVDGQNARFERVGALPGPED